MNTERTIGLNEIAQLAHIDPSDVDPTEVLSLHTLEAIDMDYIRSPLWPKTLFLLQKYFPESVGELSAYEESQKRSRRFIEQWQRFHVYAEAYLDFPPVENTYARYLPSYLQYLSAHRHLLAKTSADENYHALLLGSLSTLSSGPFHRAVEVMFPKGHSYVIDLEGVETASDGFLFANALTPPFAPASLDAIHTNFLIHQLQKKENTRQTHPVAQLFRSAYRLLKPGGMMVMIERNVTFPSSEHEEVLARALLDVGFECVVKPAVRFTDSQTVLKFLEHLSCPDVLNSKGNQRFGTETIPETFLVTAFKPNTAQRNA